MSNLKSELKNRFSNAGAGEKLLYINIAVIIIVRLFATIFVLFNIDGSNFNVLKYLALPSSFSSILHKPWTIITYMFLHYDIVHILFNMLWLYWFAKLFVQYFSEKQLIGLYIFGGLCGGALYVIAYNIFPYLIEQRDSAILMGASASVLALVVAVATIAPNFEIRLILIGKLKMIYLAGIVILSDLLFLTSNNAGGHFSHIGGALAGYIFVILFKSGVDVTEWINRIISLFIVLISPSKRTPKVKWRRPETDQEYRDKRAKKNNDLDAILDKIKKSGYGSLTSEEKRKLFDAGNN